MMAASPGSAPRKAIPQSSEITNRLWIGEILLDIFLDFDLPTADHVVVGLLLGHSARRHGGLNGFW